MPSAENVSQIYRNSQKISNIEASVAVNTNRISQIERRCDIKEAKFDKIEAAMDADNKSNQIKFEALFAYQNKAIGYAMCAGAIASGLFYIFLNKVV